jgi:hypothetical protein
MQGGQEHANHLNIVGVLHNMVDVLHNMMGVLHNMVGVLHNRNYSTQVANMSS